MKEEQEWVLSVIKTEQRRNTKMLKETYRFDDKEYHKGILNCLAYLERKFTQDWMTNSHLEHIPGVDD